MSKEVLQETSRRDSIDTAEVDLDWLTLEDGESIEWVNTPHKYSIIPAFVMGSLFRSLIGIRSLLVHIFIYEYKLCCHKSWIV